MANSNQAIKRARQAERRRRHNAARRSMMRTLVKKVVKNIEAGDGEAARAAYQGAVPKLDCLARRGLVHKNKAARHKRRLHARIRSM